MSVKTATPLPAVVVLFLILIPFGSVPAHEDGDGSPGARPEHGHGHEHGEQQQEILFQNDSQAESIVRRAFDVHGGGDAFSRLNFEMDLDDGETRTVSLVMGFKYGESGEDVLYRAVMFTEYPPDRRDVGFLGTFYRPELDKEDELWLYLPELRTSRRLMHQHGGQGHMDHGDEEQSPDEFSISELNHEELMPRWPGLDRHRLLAEDQLDGRAAYRIESVPRDSMTSSYARRIQWIDRDNGLLLRVEYFDDLGKLVKTQDQSWRKLDDSWVWDRITAVNHVNGRRTLLEQDDVHVNLGLPDNLFSRRILSRGGSAFESRISGYMK